MQGEGVVGADLNVTPDKMQEFADELGKREEEFKAAKDSIDEEIRQMAARAWGEDSTDYRAFMEKYERQMKPEAEEIESILRSHKEKARMTAENARDTINGNVGIIG